MASNGEKFVYFLMGGLVGAAVGMLFAPKSGEETRSLLESKYREGTEKLAQKARESKEALAEKSRQVAEKVTEKVDQGVETLARQKEQLAKAIEAGKQVYEREKQKLGGVEEQAEEQPSEKPVS